MGQSVAHPTDETTSAADPLDGAVTAAGPHDGHADDLLSQLAGAEIDRMLAAADVEPASTLAPPAPAPPPPRPDPVATEPPPPPPPPAAASSQVPPAASATAPVPSDLDAVLASAAAERPAPPTVGPAGDAAPLDLGAPLARTPWAVRLLAPLNAPLDAYPDRVRETVGKVAVVTLLNAVAVLAYVAIVRHHHG